MSDIGTAAGGLGKISLFNTQLSGEVLDAVQKAHDAEHKVEKGRVPTATLNAIASQKKPALPKTSMKFSKDELMAMIQKLMVANLNQQSKTQTIATKATRQRLQDLAKQNIKKLSQVQEKTKQSNTGSIVAQVFAWIAAIVTVVASVILAVVSFGSGSMLIGAALLAAAAITVTVTVLTQTGVMDKLADALANPIADMLENMGVSKSAAKIASKIAAQIIIAVAIMAVDIALAVMSGGAGVEEVASEAIKKIMKVATIAAKVTQVVGAAAQAGEAGAAVASATFSYQSQILQADVQENKAFLKRMQVMLEEEQDTLRQLIEGMSSTYVRMDSMVKDTHKANAQMLSQWASA